MSHVVITSHLSAGAREALADLLSAGVEAGNALDTSSGRWTRDDAIDACHELARAGYGTVDGGDFHLNFEVVDFSPATLPTDLLDDLVPALAAVTDMVDTANRVRTPEDPDGPANALGIRPFSILFALQTVLQLAVHDLRGDIPSAPAAAQFPYVAALLARQVLREVAA
ncbi:hypothetical protein [Curtobacterium sp. MCBD17_003]|uniref:hypothetical protein n=1 Tax=Curtobacterium sp. MCBD17_003 TaxID=2175667 RepID=UPI000DA8E7D0|nr:hypothetical protein [Curtobacterium sp. MCBD17_003]WIE54208.1 hypothetical protein DEI88_013950 [Curtobacterium sp. MCBD17_003]